MMEKLITLKKQKDFPRSKLENSFNIKYLITKQANPFYIDSSLNTQKMKKMIREKKIAQLVKFHEITKQNLQNLAYQKQIYAFERLSEELNQEKILQENLNYEIMNKAAIKIQALARGFLSRIKNQDLIVKYSQNKFYQRLNSLRKSEKFCFLNVGILVKNAANKLQKFVKKALLRMKIKRISIAYAAYLDSLKEPFYQYISKSIRVFYNNEKIKIKKREKFVRIRLEKIKENLAILTIKRFFKRKKISVKGIKNKIKRYKRLQRYSHQVSLIHPPPKLENEVKKLTDEVKPFFEKSQTISNKPGFSLISSGMVQSFIHDTLSLMGEMAKKIPASEMIYDVLSPDQNNDHTGKKQEIEERKEENYDERIDSEIFNKENSRNTQNFSELRSYRPKLNTIMPVLYQKELDNRPENHHFNRTNASIIRMMEANPARFTPKMKDDLKIRVKSANTRKNTPLLFTYLNDTFSSKLKSTEKFSYDEEKEEKVREKLKFPQKFIEKKLNSVSKAQNAEKTSEKKGKKITLKKSEAKKNEVVVPTSDQKSFKLRAKVVYSINSRIQTPKSTKSCSGRRQSTHLIRRNSDFSPRTLSFEAALPEYSELLTNYMRPLYLQLRPKTGKSIS